MYLTLADYKVMDIAKSDVTDEDYKELAILADSVVDNLTHSYYQSHDLSKDTDEIRVRLFNRALALEINFLIDSGYHNITDGYDSASHVGIGHTSVDVANSNAGKGLTTLTSPLIRDLLLRAGLMYRGVDYYA
ncbi:hypothetical protein [Pediococcus pentosaceus]|uniref:hypothetical protein n=1 Tax=Pediococcus pentosaceus TaxID=1255 RepID=UPI002FBD94BE